MAADYARSVPFELRRFNAVGSQLRGGGKRPVGAPSEELRKVAPIPPRLPGPGDSAPWRVSFIARKQTCLCAFGRIA